MSIFIIVIFLLIGNWLLSDLLIFLPINLMARFSSFSWLAIAIVALLFLGWCLGDD